MRLLEVIAGLESSEEALEVARAAGERDGQARDRRRRRPRLPRQPLQPAVRPRGARSCSPSASADVETIDRICRLGGGFRMGPFELSDLVGVDVGFEVAKSFYELSFGEPRWRPNPLVAQLVAAGRHGRKTGRGWYAYERRPAPPGRPGPARGRRRRRAARRHRRRPAGRRGAARPRGERGLRRGRAARRRGRRAVARDRLRRRGRRAPAPGRPARASSAPTARCTRSTPAAARSASTPSRRSATRGSSSSRAARRRRPSPPSARRRSSRASAATSRGSRTRPGLVLGRIVCQLVNEACFAVTEGVGTPEDIDDGMVLGLNYPRGPFGWLEAIGPTTCSPSSTRCGSSSARSATAPRRCCAGWRPRRT